MKTTPQGIVAIARVEGIVPAPYLDSVGKWTFGIGHTDAAGEPDPEKMPRGMPADMDAAMQRVIDVFRDDLRSYEARVNKAITRPLSPHEFDALVSFDINTGGIFRAKLTGEINSGNMSGDGFMGWLRPAEIIGRRREEQRLFRTGRYSDGPIPIWRTDNSGRLRGLHSHMAAERLLELLSPAAPAKQDDAPAASGGFWRHIWNAIRRE